MSEPKYKINDIVEVKGIGMQRGRVTRVETTVQHRYEVRSTENGDTCFLQESSLYLSRDGVLARIEAKMGDLDSQIRSFREDFGS